MRTVAATTSSDPFEEYRAVRAAQTPLIISVAEDVEVSFPGAPTLQWRLDFLTLATLNPESPREEVCFALIPKLFKDEEAFQETFDTIGEHLSQQEVFALLRGVVRHYELTEEDTNPPKAPRRTSEDSSSDSSEPSTPTSSVTSTG